MKTKKSQFSMDLIIKKRSNSLRVIPSKKVISNTKAINKIFKSMNMKNQQTTQKIYNLEELSKSVKENGVNEINNYLYLKKLKENKDKNLAEEFEQFSYEKRI
jgi:flagellar motor component MotA